MVDKLDNKAGSMLWVKGELPISTVRTADTRTVTPALRQTVTAITTTNTWCTLFKWDSFNIKVHVVYMVLALTIISLLNQQKTLLLSLHL